MLRPLLEVVLHIDLRKHSKIMPFECFFCGSHCVVKSHVYSLGEMVGHLRLLFSSQPRFSIPDPCVRRNAEELPSSTRVNKNYPNNSAENLIHIKAIGPAGCSI